MNKKKVLSLLTATAMAITAMGCGASSCTNRIYSLSEADLFWAYGRRSQGMILIEVKE